MIRVLIAWLMLLSTQAATYYVSTSGNNTNAGSLAAPWLTVQKYWDVAAPGDTGIVLSGDYAAASTTTKSGSSNAPISLIGSNWPSIYGVTVKTNDYISIEGFQINGTGRANAIMIEGSDYVRIIGNVFTNCPDRSLQLHYTVPTSDYAWVERNTFLGAANVCMGVMGDGHTITNNYFTQQPGTVSEGTGDAIITLARNTLFIHNTFDNWSRPMGDLSHIDIIQTFTTGNSGLHVSSNVWFMSNLVTNCVNVQIGMVEDQEFSSFPGCLTHWYFVNNLYIDVSGGLNVYAPNFHFYNNTYIRSGNSSGSPLLFRRGLTRGEGTNGVAKGNIFYRCGSNPTNVVGGYYGFDPSTNSLTFTGDYNFVVGIGAGITKTGFTDEGREVNGINGEDPLFVSSTNFRLTSLSPARGAGIDLSPLFNTDIEGNPRGANWSMGAYQSNVRSAVRSVNATVRSIQP